MADMESKALQDVAQARRAEDTAKQHYATQRSHTRDTVLAARAAGHSVAQIQQAGGWKQPKSVYDILGPTLKRDKVHGLGTVDANGNRVPAPDASA